MDTELKRNYQNGSQGYGFHNLDIYSNTQK